jgi:hypothetical protein
MNNTRHGQARLIILSALLTGLCLGGTLSFPFWYGLGLYYAPASIREQLSSYLSPDTTPELWLPSAVFGGVVWGLALGGLSGIRPLWRLAVAGGIGVWFGEFIATFFLPFIGIPRTWLTGSPNHIRWAVELAFGVGFGGSVTALAIGLAVRPGLAALWLALGVILAAAIPVLIVDMSLDALGIRWGAGNANMAKVAGLAFPAATLSAGALMGWYIARFGPQH